MCLAKIVFAVFAWTTVTNYVFVSGQEIEPTIPTKQPEETERTEPPPVENHTFVALIDILFVDGSKRQCTGTIVHDNVVVTAAHCFLDHNPGEYADIELTGSFVVIGTRKMFDTGYENYLPIERILTHPRYKGWTADLALVYTFAGMTTDKPGYALPLLEASASTPVDSNVTILSWGRCPDDPEKPGTKGPGQKRKRCTSSEEANGSCERTTRKPLRTGPRSSEQEDSSELANSRQRSFQRDKSESSPADLARVTTAHNSHRVLGIVQKPSLGNSPENLKHSDERYEPHEPSPLNVTIRPDNHTTSIQNSRAVTAESEGKKKGNLTKALRRHRKQRSQKAFRHMSVVDVKDMELRDPVMVLRRREIRQHFGTVEGIKSYYKNWRRQAKPQGPKENTLTIETFGFVNVQTCKKLVDRVKPSYGINTNEVVCYSADEHYVSDDDSGAPAVRQGHLVGVTVGGVECEGDHVAVGMKMNCFCSWIAENLPEDNVDWQCCEDCCRGDEPKPRKLRNKHY